MKYLSTVHFRGEEKEPCLFSALHDNIFYQMGFERV